MFEFPNLRLTLRTVTIWTAVMCLFAPRHARAQSSAPGESAPISEIRKNYPIHAGPLYAKPSILLKELGVDTNVFNDGAEPKADFTFTLTPGTELVVPVARRALLRTLVAVDGVYYQRFASERSLNPQVTARGEIYARRLTLFAESGYVNSRQRANAELDLRARRLQTDVAGGVYIGLSPTIAIDLTARASKTRFDRAAVFQGQQLDETLNDRVRKYTVAARKQLTPLTRVSLLVESQQDRFEASPLRDTNSVRVMPGVDFKPRALVSGSAYVGTRSFRPKSALLPAETALVSCLALSYLWLGRTMFGVTYDRDFEFSFDASTPYYVADNVGVSIRQAIGPHFDAIASASRHRNDYRRFLGVPTTPPSLAKVETTESYGLNLGYRFRRQTRVGFGATYSSRESTTDLARGYTGFRFATTVSSGITR